MTARKKPATPEFDPGGDPELPAPEPAPEAVLPDELLELVETHAAAHGYTVETGAVPVLPVQSPPPGTQGHADISAAAAKAPVWYGEVALFRDVQNEGGMVLVLIDGRNGETTEKKIPPAMVRLATGGGLPIPGMGAFKNLLGGLKGARGGVDE